MTDADLIRIAFLGVLSLGLATGSLTMAGANIYDARAYKLKRQVNRPNSKIRNYRPLVTIALYIDNEAENLEAWLANLPKAGVRKWELIVIDTFASQANRQLLKDFQKRHKAKTVKIIRKRKPSDSQTAILGSIKQFHGEIVLVTSPSFVLDQNGLQRAVRYFAASGADAVVPAGLVDQYPALLNVLFRYKAVTNIASQKARQAFGFKLGGLGANIFYRRSAIAPKMSGIKYIYAADLILTQQQNYSLGRSIVSQDRLITARQGSRRHSIQFVVNAYKLLWQLAAEPLILGYMAYVLVYSHYAALVELSWAIIAFYLLFAVWTTERLGFLNKLRLSALLPVVMLLYVIYIFARSLWLVFSFITKASQLLIIRFKPRRLRSKKPSAGFKLADKTA